MSRDVSLTFDIYGRMLLQIERGDDVWLIYRLRDGRRSPYFDIVIPPEMPASGIQTFLDDMFHEGGGGQSVRLISDG
jgi:hypothetical protein